MWRKGRKFKSLRLSRLTRSMISGLVALLRRIPYLFMLLWYMACLAYKMRPKLPIGKRHRLIKHEGKEDGPYLNRMPIHKIQTLGELNAACGMRLKWIPEAARVSGKSELTVDIEPENGDGKSVHVEVRKPDGREKDDIEIEDWIVVLIEGREDSEGLLCLYKDGAEVTVGLRLQQVAEIFGKPDWSKRNPMKSDSWTYGYGYFRLHDFEKKGINRIEVSMVSWIGTSQEAQVEKEHGPAGGREGVYLNGTRIGKGATVRELTDSCNLQLRCWLGEELGLHERGLEKRGLEKRGLEETAAFLETKDGWHENICIAIRVPEGKEQKAADVRDWIVTDINAGNKLVSLYKGGNKIEVGMKMSRALGILGRPNRSNRKHRPVAHQYGCFVLYIYNKKRISGIKVNLSRMQGMRL